MRLLPAAGLVTFDCGNTVPLLSGFCYKSEREREREQKMVLLQVP